MQIMCGQKINDANYVWSEDQRCKLCVVIRSTMQITCNVKNVSRLNKLLCCCCCYSRIRLVKWTEKVFYSHAWNKKVFHCHVWNKKVFHSHVWTEKVSSIFSPASKVFSRDKKTLDLQYLTLLYDNLKNLQNFPDPILGICYVFTVIHIIPLFHS
jgi:hypothetical protein